MMLTASLGFAAKNRSVSAIFVRPSKRKTDMAVLRNAAIRVFQIRSKTLYLGIRARSACVFRSIDVSDVHRCGLR